jgi:uncharacterized protein YxeA
MKRVLAILVAVIIGVAIAGHAYAGNDQGGGKSVGNDQGNGKPTQAS